MNSIRAIATVAAGVAVVAVGYRLWRKERGEEEKASAATVARLHSTRSSMEPAFEPGSTVIVVSVVSVSDLNGKRGIVKKFVPGLDRYVVQVDGKQVDFALKPVNLQAAPASRMSTWAARTMLSCRAFAMSVCDLCMKLPGAFYNAWRAVMVVEWCKQRATAIFLMQLFCPLKIAIAIIGVYDLCRAIAILVVHWCEKNGIETVLAVMAANTTSAKVQRYACAVLCLLAISEANKAKIAEAGGIEAALAAMAAHTANENVQLLALLLLDFLAINYANKAKIVEASGVEAVLAAMAAHTTSSKVQRYARALLAKLENDASKAKIDKAGDIKASNLASSLDGIKDQLEKIKSAARIGTQALVEHVLHAHKPKVGKEVSLDFTDAGMSDSTKA